MYTKEFDKWNGIKKKINGKGVDFYVGEREIWWCSVGVNVGIEIDGKNHLHERPVLIFKKHNKDMYSVLPITSTDKTGRFSYEFVYDGKDESVILNQIKIIDKKRLDRKIGTLDESSFINIRQKFLSLYKYETPLARGISEAEALNNFSISDNKNLSSDKSDNKSKIVILVGRSGSGKGTQGQFIKKFLEETTPNSSLAGGEIIPNKNVNDAEVHLHYLSTGDEMRRIMKQASYTAKLSREYLSEGKLQPMFFSVYVWAKYLMEHVHGGDNIIFDGVPRRKSEADILHSAVKFYGWHKPVVINIDVSEDECVRRMIDRNREDDNLENYKKKMEWYRAEVEPMLEFYKESNQYAYVRINGEDTPENISKHIKNFLENHYNLAN